MTTQQKLDFIRGKCVEANLDKMWTWKCRQPHGFQNKLLCGRTHTEPIGLADMLLASEKEWATLFFAGGGLIDGKPPRERLPEGLRLYQIVRKWNLLKDDLTQQSEETIGFLYELLK
jgi:hypothetical protein